MKAATHFAAADFSVPLLPGTTVLEASAGTGKTYALCALYLRLILEHDLGVREILVTTFTKAATAELRGRIRELLRSAHDALAAGCSEDKFLSALVEHWRQDAEVMRARLAQSLRDFDEAAIFTIDGFCLRMLSDRAFESGTLLDLSLLPDISEIIREIAADYWRTRFYASDDCLSSAASGANLSVEALAKALKERQQQPTARILPEATPEACAALCQALSGIFADIKRCWKKEEQALRLHFSEEANHWAKYQYKKAHEVALRLDAIAGFLDGTCPSLEGHEALTFFAESAVKKNTKKHGQPPSLQFFALCEKFKIAADRFSAAVVLDFLHWAPEPLALLKAQRGVQSYGDLLARLNDSLRGEAGDAMTASIRSRFRAALIDEFQDTDPVQDAIFERLFDDGKTWLFLIGDPKQAIYSFRGADVFTYLKAARRAGEQRYTLATNYRSAEQLVNATNRFFAHNPRAFVLEEIAFQPVESSGLREEERFSGDSIAAPFRVWFWEGDTSASIDSVRQGLIRATAAEIARLLSHGRLGQRAVVPADIAILTATNVEARTMQAELASRSIPGVLLQTESVFRSRQARELFWILTAILRPADEARLRAALLTDALGLGFSEIEALSADESGWEEWIARFRMWHSTWIARGFMTMFQKLLRDADIPKRLLASIDGERRLTNILHLAELLQKAALEEQLGPRGLLRWLGKQLCEPASGVEEHEVRLERDDDAVRIITVHKSKGLEYNIVFCPLLVRPAEASKSPVRFHDPETSELIVDFGSADMDQYAALAETEALADEVRKLYVALTRARQRCDIVWGLYYGAKVSAAGWLIHPPPHSASPRPDELETHIGSLSDEQLRGDLESLAGNSGGAIAVHPVPDLQAPAYLPTASSPEALHARQFGGFIQRDYCVSSFSSLTATHNPELPDYDEPRPENLPPETQEPPQGIHALPGGTRTGICIHEIFEELDFTDPAAIDPLVRSKLAAFSFPPALWAESVAACVRRVLDVPLASGFRLAELHSSSRLAELEFFLPAGRLKAEPLRELLVHDGLDQLDFGIRQGWLKGFIDLVAEHRGRFYLFDWKTNRLGDRSTAYGAPALASAMASHRYGLQLHLYALALHRYLRHRVPDYDYERHFGGAYYLFIRGVDPQRPDLGVVHRRPELKAIEALERWLEGASHPTGEELQTRSVKRRSGKGTHA